jgi:hypothetical protein
MSQMLLCRQDNVLQQNHACCTTLAHHSNYICMLQVLQTLPSSFAAPSTALVGDAVTDTPADADGEFLSAI